MEHISIISDLIIIFLVSLPIIYVFHKMKLPPIAGFLAAGIIIGPHGFGFITNIKDIEAMAEIGVVLLLFTIGLEISMGRLMQMKRYIFLGGGLQTGITIIVSTALLVFLKIEPAQAIFSGMLISLSSTAIVLKLLSDRQDLESPHGRISIGILIFQDLAVVPMMLLLPVLGAGNTMSVQGVLLKLLLAFGLLGVVFVASRYLMPRMLYHLAKLRLREVFTLGIILFILSTAFLTDKIGLSLALGAFIAGVILSESDYSHQVTAEIVPFKDAFNSLFFVSIGLLLNLNFIMQYPMITIWLTLGIIVIKVLIVMLIVKFLGYPSRTGLLTALSLAQIGEFSFVLAQAGIAQQLIAPVYFNAFIASSIFTMLLTPLFVNLAPHLAHKLTSEGSMPEGEKEEKLNVKDHVIITGYGLNGKNIVRVLRDTGIPYIILELNPETVREEKAKGEKIIFGDVTRQDVLKEANIEQANIIVFAISDPASTRMGIKLAKELNSSIYCIVRTRYVSEIEELKKLGADQVIPEEFETSLQIFSKVLERYHIPLNIIMKQSNIIRHESYEMLRLDPGLTSPLTHIDKILAEGLTETYYVEDVNNHIGQSLRSLNLRAMTGATIIAILRNGNTTANPPGTEILMSGDTLVIYGTHKAVDKAMQMLNS